jgi:hypothetical protein
VRRSKRAPHPMSPVCAKSKHKRPKKIKSLAIAIRNPRIAASEPQPSPIMGYTHDDMNSDAVVFVLWGSSIRTGLEVELRRRSQKRRLYDTTRILH